MLSSEHIESKVVTLTSKSAPSKNHFETKPQAKFATYDQIFDTKEEELIKLKGKQHMESN